MKKIYLIMSLLLITTLAKTQQVINGGLNTWMTETAGPGTYQDPTGPFLNFYDSLLAYNGLPVGTITQNNSGTFEGASNAKLGIINVGQNQVGGLLVYGNLDSNGDYILTETVPRPSGISFQYKISTINNLDTIFLSIASNNFSNYYYEFHSSQLTWTYYEQLFNYTGSGVDKIGFSFSIFNESNSYNDPSLTFEVDDVKYLYTNGLTEKLGNEKIIEIYPNPTTEFVQFELENASDKSFVIYDALGAKVYTNNSLNSDNKIDVSSFNNGTYFYILIDNSLNEIIDRGNFVKM